MSDTPFSSATRLYDELLTGPHAMVTERRLGDGAARCLFRGQLQRGC
jgi:hypothetical protein